MSGARFSDGEMQMAAALAAENHYNVQGYMFQFQNRGPSLIYRAPNGGELYVAGERDLWEEHGAEFLRSLHPKGQVFTCKNETPPEIHDACNRVCWPKPLQFAIAYSLSLIHISEPTRRRGIS